MKNYVKPDLYVVPLVRHDVCIDASAFNGGNNYSPNPDSFM